MKKFFAYLFLILLFLLILIFILPYVFKGKIETEAKNQINKNLNAEVDFESINLSLIRNFPDLNVSLNDLAITGKDKFYGDTLLTISSFSSTVDLFKLLGDNKVNIKSVFIDQPYFYGKVLSDSTANWDIAISDSLAVEDEDTAASDMVISLKSFEVTNGTVIYNDSTLNFMTKLAGIDFILSGDFSADSTNIEIGSEIESIDLDYGGIRYISNARANLEADIGANLSTGEYYFKDNELSVNQLDLIFEGMFAMLDEGYKMDINFKTGQTDFKTLLSMVPAIYSRDFEDIKTEGELNLSGWVKGVYKDENNLPAFRAELAVSNGMFSYPDLPKSVKDIQISALAEGKGGDPDNIVTRVEKFHLELGGNPFDAKLTLQNPVSDPLITAEVVGVIDFETLNDAIPMEDVKIRGKLNSDVVMYGRYSAIEEERYEDFKTDGSITLTDFTANTKDMPQGVTISSAQLNFTPQYVDMPSFNAQIGESDLSLKGRIENFIAYALKDELLKGNFTHHSDFFNVNEFLSDDEETTETEDSVELSVFKVPENIDFNLNSTFGKILYDKLTINNVKGNIIIRNGVVNLNNLSMNLLEGQVVMNASYSVPVNNPEVEFDFDMNNISINSAVNSFSMIDSIFPAAKHAAGVINTELAYSGQLKENMFPDLSTINGKGNILSELITFSGSKSQQALSSLLNNDKYKNIEAEDVKINFDIVKGNIVIEPFKINLFGEMATIKGRQGLDRTMDYQVIIPVPVKDLGSDIANLYATIPNSSPEDEIMATLNITGSITSPNAKLDAEASTAQIREKIKASLKQEVDEKKEEVKEEVKSQVDSLKKKAKDKLKDLFN